MPLLDAAAARRGGIAEADAERHAGAAQEMLAKVAALGELEAVVIVPPAFVSVTGSAIRPTPVCEMVRWL